jgi:predicted nucleic acid-binding protein
MMLGLEVCVDASLIIQTVTQEPQTALAEELLARWRRDGTRLIAPAFFEVEADSIIRKKLLIHRHITLEPAEQAFTDLAALPIEQVSVPEQRERAWEIAREFGMANVYDATYLALADLRGCEFWTADERLFNRVKDRLSFVRWLGDFAPESAG